MRNLCSVLMVLFGLVTATASAQALEVGDTAPNLELVNILPNGSDSTHAVLASAKGPVLLDFFSVTCGYCIRNLPKLTQLTTDVAGHATVRIVGIDRNEQRMRNFHSENRELFNMDFALDNARKVKDAYGVTATPTYFVVDANGKIVFKEVGELSDEQVAQVRALLLGGR